MSWWANGGSTLFRLDPVSGGTSTKEVYAFQLHPPTARSHCRCSRMDSSSREQPCHSRYIVRLGLHIDLLLTFLFPAVPTVTATAPAAGPRAGGNTITVQGSDFINLSTILVRFLNASQSVNVTAQGTYLSPGAITVTVPAIATECQVSVSVAQNGIAFVAGAIYFAYSTFLLRALLCDSLRLQRLQL